MPAQPPQQITATVRTEPGSCPHGLSRQNSSLNPGCIAAPLDTKERALPTENELTLCQDTNSEHRKFKANILHNNLKQKKKRQAFSVGAITERCNNMHFPHKGSTHSHWYFPSQAYFYTCRSYLFQSTPHSTWRQSAPPDVSCRTQIMARGEGLQVRAATGCCWEMGITDYLLHSDQTILTGLQSDWTLKQAFCLQWLE